MSKIHNKKSTGGLGRTLRGIDPDEKIIKRVTGIEPVPSPWQGGILPLDHTRRIRIRSLIPICIIQVFVF